MGLSRELTNKIFKELNSQDTHYWNSVYTNIKESDFNDYSIHMMFVYKTITAPESNIYSGIRFFISKKLTNKIDNILYVEEFFTSVDETSTKLIKEIQNELIETEDRYNKYNLNRSNLQIYDDHKLYISKDIQFFNKLSVSMTENYIGTPNYLLKFTPLSDYSEFIIQSQELYENAEVLMNYFPNRRALVGALDYKKNIEIAISHKKDYVKNLEASLKAGQICIKQLEEKYNDMAHDNFINKYFGEGIIESRRLLKEIGG